MNELLLNQVVNFAGPDWPFQGLARVLWIDISADRAILIPIDQRHRHPPKSFSLKHLLNAMEKKEILPAICAPRPISLLTDEEIERRLPPQSSGKSSFPIAYRNFWWNIIGPIVSGSIRYFSGNCSLGSLIEPRVKEFNLSKQRVYLVLYRFWAEGSTRSALLPDTINCGGKGKRRAGKNIALGRKRLESQGAQSKNDNYALTQEDIERIQFGWRTYVRPNVPIQQAYIKTLQLFWVDEWEQKDGNILPKIKPIGQRPSQRQFQYHGESQDPSERAYRKHLSDREWNLNHRALSGKKRTGLHRIGAVGQADASTNDVHLVSVFDRTKIVGLCSHILIADEFTGLITGFYVGWSVDADAVRLAILHSASSKIDYCARYGITTTQEEFPQTLFSSLLVDRGEFNSAAVRNSLENLHVSIEYVAPGRADGKGLIEAKHHTIHASSGHNFPGTTYGRIKKRGEQEPALTACINIHEYTADLIRAVIHHNTKALVPEILTTEMRQDGVAPTRISIWQWAKKKGYVAYIDCSRERLISNLCPEISAVVRADGIYLMHERGNKSPEKIVIKSLRYLSSSPVQTLWLERARRRGSFRIRLRYNPYDLQRVWYIDPDIGMQQFDLDISDPLLEKIGTLDDILNDDFYQKIEIKPYKEMALQSKSDLSIQRESVVQAAITLQRREIKALSKKPSKIGRLKDRKKNRSQEIRNVGKASLPFGMPFERIDEKKALDEAQPLCASSDDLTEDSENQAINDWLDTEG